MAALLSFVHSFARSPFFFWLSRQARNGPPCHLTELRGRTDQTHMIQPLSRQKTMNKYAIEVQEEEINLRIRPEKKEKENKDRKKERNRVGNAFQTALIY